MNSTSYPCIVHIHVEHLLCARHSSILGVSAVNKRQNKINTWHHIHKQNNTGAGWVDRVVQGGLSEEATSELGDLQNENEPEVARAREITIKAGTYGANPCMERNSKGE